MSNISAGEAHQLGTVEKFDAIKGYGFISPERGRRSIFFHWSELTGIKGYRTIDQGAAVEFDMARDESGRLQAVNVRAF